MIYTDGDIKQCREYEKELKTLKRGIDWGIAIPLRF